MRIKSRPETPCGSCRIPKVGISKERLGQFDHERQTTQQQDACDQRQASGRFAGPWLAGGEAACPARMEMKTMLSMPRMISSTVNVSRLIQISGDVIHP